MILALYCLKIPENCNIELCLTIYANFLCTEIYSF